MPAHLARMPEQAPVQIFELGDLGRLARLVHRLAPLHLLHQELGGIAVLFSSAASTPASSSRYCARAAACAAARKAFVDPRRPLHRQRRFSKSDRCAWRSGCTRPCSSCQAAIERAFVEGDSGAAGRRGRSSPASGRCSSGPAQTLKLSPHPHWSLTFGLLNLKPSLRPSDEVELGAVEIGQALGVDEHLDAVALEDLVLGPSRRRTRACRPCPNSPRSSRPDACRRPCRAWR
jgi:hypothetical protein